MGESVSSHAMSCYLRYLPMVYFLPQELLSKCPTLSKLPRNLAALSASQSALALLQSDNWLHATISDSELRRTPTGNCLLSGLTGSLCRHAWSA
jgi:hypothetical protein